MKLQNAGKVIDSGGFGCIFSPRLKCENEKNYSDVLNENEKKLSKLMTKEHAEDEYELITELNNILNVIPNYQDYFLINNFTLCRPSKITKQDLINYTTECKPLIKKGITTNNINTSIDKIKMLTMPYGGINIDTFIDEYWINSDIIMLNNALIQLLNNGILPMNKLGVYHCDIKDSNVLVEISETGLNTRLIDWGLSVIKDDDDDDIPSNLYRRPFQFNVPFSSILFSDELTTMYNDFIKQHNNPTYYEIREFVINYIFVWNDIRGPGHLSTINNIFKRFVENDLEGVDNDTIKNHVIEYEFTYFYIVNYISEILFEYTLNNKLDLREYFDNVFLKNIDVWGFMSIYLAFIDKIYNYKSRLNDYGYDFFYKIKDIIIRYLYSNPIKVIDTKSLSIELTNMNKIIKNIEFKSKNKINYDTENYSKSDSMSKSKSKSKSISKSKSKSKSFSFVKGGKYPKKRKHKTRKITTRKY